MLQAIGNVLDLPGSMVRDALAFRNPLDQLLSPFSQDDRTSGEQLIEDYTGSSGHSTLGALLSAGLDPLTYAGGFLASGAAKALGLGSKANAAYQAARQGATAARGAVGSAGALKATANALPGQVRGLAGQALNYVDDATRMPYTGGVPAGAGWGVPQGPRMGLGQMASALGGAARTGRDATIDALYGLQTPAANTAKFAGGLSAALLPAMSRAGADEGAYEDEQGNQYVPTPTGMVQIPAGARFSLSGQNAGPGPMPMPDWASRYNYSMRGNL